MVERSRAAHKISEVMQKEPVTLDAGSSAREAAQAMQRHDIGSVIVERGKRVKGIVTDRDLVVRLLAEGRSPDEKLGELCSENPLTLGPEDETDTAVRLMRENAIRRIPVVQDGRPVGIVSIGDLAVHRDPGSALGRISAAPPSR